MKFDEVLEFALKTTAFKGAKFKHYDWRCGEYAFYDNTERAFIKINEEGVGSPLEMDEDVLFSNDWEMIDFKVKQGSKYPMWDNDVRVVAINEHQQVDCVETIDKEMRFSEYDFKQRVLDCVNDVRAEEKRWGAFYDNE